MFYLIICFPFSAGSDGGDEDDNSNIERVDPGLASKVVVELKNMRKVYSTHKKWWELWSFDNGRSLRTKRVHREVEAIKGLNLKLHEGERFAIAVSGLCFP